MVKLWIVAPLSRVTLHYAERNATSVSLIFSAGSDIPFESTRCTTGR